jgi:multicomponent Na+:H+ antiporter subunit F
MIGVDIGIALMLVTVAAAALRMARGPGDADRAVAADLLFFAIIGLIALVGVRLASSATFDIVLVATLVGFLATVSLARAVTRGKR